MAWYSQFFFQDPKVNLVQLCFLEFGQQMKHDIKLKAPLPCATSKITTRRGAISCVGYYHSFWWMTGAKQPHRTLASLEQLNLSESSELSIYLPSPDFSHSLCMKLGCVNTVITFWSVIEFMKTVSSSKIILPRDTASINVCINIFQDVCTTVTSPNGAFFQNISLSLSHTLDFLHLLKFGALLQGVLFMTISTEKWLLGTIQEMRPFISSLITRRII